MIVNTLVNKVGDESDEGSTSSSWHINYWNMPNFRPFFPGSNDEFVKKHQEIGDEAATKIQTWWRRRRSRLGGGAQGQGQGRLEEEVPLLLRHMLCI